MKNELIKAMIIVLTSFVASAIIMIFMKKIAKHLGAMDMPREEDSKIRSGWNIFSIFNRVYVVWRAKY